MCTRKGLSNRYLFTQKYNLGASSTFLVFAKLLQDEAARSPPLSACDSSCHSALPSNVTWEQPSLEAC